jgi:hypothetical protein
MIQGKLFNVEVGCRYRWPYDCAHPDCWQPPIKGLVLALDDPRAWRHTLAFPEGVYPDGPPQDKVTEHVSKCLSEDLLAIAVPVLYTNGDGKEFVQWDSPDHLLSYVEELAAWQEARQQAYKRATKPA